MKSTNKKVVTYTKIDETEFRSKFSLDSLCFYKGIPQNYFSEDFGKINTLDFIRPSKEAKINFHFYDEMLNNLSSWEFMPLRKKSIIGTTSLEVANFYSQLGGVGSNIYVVVCLDATVAKCPTDDIMTSFNNEITQNLLKENSVSFLKQFNDELYYYFKFLKMNDDEIRNLRYSEIIKLLNDADFSAFNDDHPILKYFEHDSDVSISLNRIFDPEMNGFITDPNLKLTESGNGNEVFASGTFILCEYELYKALIQE